MRLAYYAYYDCSDSTYATISVQNIKQKTVNADCPKSADWLRLVQQLSSRPDCKKSIPGFRFVACFGLFIMFVEF